MINLDSPADCRRGIEILKKLVQGGVAPARGAQPCVNEGQKPLDGAISPPKELPLRKKLAIIKQRGVWRHLVKIAQDGDSAKSLPEWDAQLDLPRNKMRSLKAIFAKLENRWDIAFLQPDPDAGVDDAGNPRYRMPVRVRNQILNLAQ